MFENKVLWFPRDNGMYYDDITDWEVYNQDDVLVLRSRSSSVILKR